MDDFDNEGDDLLSSLDVEATILQKVSGTSLTSRTINGAIKVPSAGVKDVETCDFEDDDDDILASVNMDVGKHNVSEAAIVHKDPDVDVPDTFPFPFEPYNIQQGFMSELYRSLELGKIGIFESPTGTGKSLSLICGALKWLKDFQDRQKQELEALLKETEHIHSEDNKENSLKKETNKEELDWISDYKSKKETDEKRNKIKEDVEQRLKRESKLKEIKKSRHRGKRKRAQLEDEFDELIKGAASDIKDAYKSEIDKLTATESGLEDDGDDNLLVAEYHSDGEGETTADSEEEEKDDQEEVHCIKIYFCSRTHSQLSQFVREVIKSPYGDDTRVISLGSRQNLCVNDAVLKLKSLSLINDTCRDLQKKKSGKKDKLETKRKKGEGQGCPYYHEDRIHDYRDSALLEVRDIEQLVTLGKQMKACPYYGTRRAIPDAEIVALPYNTLLHKSTREASGIQLQGNIVIIDEAHNLLETINTVHSSEITGSQLVRAHCQLRQYESKYRSRLKAQNLMYIKQILFILSNLAKCIGGKTDMPADKQTCPVTETRLWTINDFLFQCQLDNVNMFKVIRYCQRSQISKKLNGFVEKYQSEIVMTEQDKKEETSVSGLSNFLKTISGKGDNTQQPDEPVTVSTDRRDVSVLSSPLMHIEGFLLALTNADKDGRIVINKQRVFSQCSIKFLLLNPAVHFSSVVQEARAVIVAGGTMQPISEFKDQLFHAAGVQPERILEYSCGHVIPADQLLPIAMTTGPTGVPLDFTFQNRTSATLLDDLGRLVCNICNVVPGGVICFFASYDYEKYVYTHWEKTGLLAKLEHKKKVFREPKRAGQVDQVLAEFTACIQKSCGNVTGSILFSVVGGKMSEGINFSDDMGRCVMMVGMPYPNINSPELKEKMDYLNANFPRDSEGRQAGQVHYENLCMKAVNQSIGRAIRHSGDYATILLLDKRYSRGTTVSKLPGWISKHLRKMDKFGTVLAAVSQFFSNKKPG